MDNRLTALRRFAIAITVLNIFGHTILGFEQSLLQLFICLGTGYFLALFFELLKSKSQKRKAAYSGSIQKLIDFLLPAHITSLAISMLMYANETVWPFIFAVAIAMGTKELFRAPVNGKYKHFLNPSNTGIAITLLLFPWVGIAPPYQFTTNVTGHWDYLIPGIIIFTGTLINAKLTNRLPLILGWGFGFLAQGLFRDMMYDSTNFAAILPITGMSFLLFTFYMITDPATTPTNKRGQYIFGCSVALVYGVLAVLNVVYTFFFALIIVCASRGIYLNIYHYLNQKYWQLDTRASMENREQEVVEVGENRYSWYGV